MKEDRTSCSSLSLIHKKHLYALNPCRVQPNSWFKGLQAGDPIVLPDVDFITWTNPLDQSHFHGLTPIQHHSPCFWASPFLGRCQELPVRIIFTFDHLGTQWIGSWGATLVFRALLCWKEPYLEIPFVHQLLAETAWTTWANGSCDYRWNFPTSSLIYMSAFSDKYLEGTLKQLIE